jgi:hypothetical protein
MLDGAPSLPAGRFDPSWLGSDAEGDVEDVMACVDAALTDLKIRRGSAFASPPPYPCFAADQFTVAEHHLVRDAADPLDKVGLFLREFRHSRAPGPPPTSGGSCVLPNTEGFREIAFRHRRRLPPGAPFRDGALGLPVVYTEKDEPGSVTVEPVVDGVSARRASPLWLRVTLINGRWGLRSLAFHAEWLPAKVALHVKLDQRERPVAKPTQQVAKPTQQDVRAELKRWFAEIDADAAFSRVR